MSDSRATIVDRLLRGRLGPEAIAPLPEADPALSTAEAYEIQSDLERALTTLGDRVVGWKVGFSNAAVRESFGLDEPAAGFVLASGVYGSGDGVPCARFVSLGVEAEVAFLLKSDLAGPGVTVASALLAIEGALPALELVDFRFSGKPRGSDMIADGVAGNAVVLGHPLTAVAGIDLALEGVVFEQNGRLVATNTAAEVMGNPLHSLAWLANTLGRMGRRLSAGELVLTGTISKVLRPGAGDSVRASFTRLGSVGCRFA
jgi:2-keto-4-pentenoate hydratase